MPLHSAIELDGQEDRRISATLGDDDGLLEFAGPFDNRLRISSKVADGPDLGYAASH